MCWQIYNLQKQNTQFSAYYVESPTTTETLLDREKISVPNQD